MLPIILKHYSLSKNMFLTIGMTIVLAALLFSLFFLFKA